MKETKKNNKQSIYDKWLKMAFYQKIVCVQFIITIVYYTITFFIENKGKMVLIYALILSSSFLSFYEFIKAIKAYSDNLPLDKLILLS